MTCFFQFPKLRFDLARSNEKRRACCPIQGLVGASSELGGILEKILPKCKEIICRSRIPVTTGQQISELPDELQNTTKTTPNGAMVQIVQYRVSGGTHVSVYTGRLQQNELE